MFLTEVERKEIFEAGRNAAAQKLSKTSCPYSSEKSPERLYIWMGGYHEYLTEAALSLRSQHSSFS